MPAYDDLPGNGRRRYSRNFRARSDSGHRGYGDKPYGRGDSEYKPSASESRVRQYPLGSSSKSRRAGGSDRIQNALGSEGLGSVRSRRSPSRAYRQPLTTEESRYQVEKSREEYEKARANRSTDISSIGMRGRKREVIDGRGSIDSRAFNERNELVGYTIDNSDRHEPMLDVPAERGKWLSSSGNRSLGAADGQMSPRRSRNQDLRSLSDTISGRSDFQGNQSEPAIPLSIKILGALIIILLLVLIFILVF